jgi:putative membrane protein
MSKKVLNIVSVVIPVVVALLFGIKVQLGEWTKVLPHVNAAFNSITAILLISAFFAVKTGNIGLHKKLMLGAVFFGLLFLVNYIMYHISNEETKYGGEGVVRIIYFVLLVTHILLAIVEVWFILRALYYAMNQDFDKHVKVVKFAFPIWLYVSVTGVVIYLMISPYYSV